MKRNHSKKTRQKMSKAHKGKPSAFKGCKHTEKAKRRISEKLKGHKGVKNQSKIVEHHIYLKENSNDIIKLDRKLHGKLHWEIYNYLYQTQGKKGIDKYIKWFKNKYKIIAK